MSNLPPPDLLSLARTSKWLRGLLMKRSARYIWLRSFELVGLPPVPFPDECAEPEVVEALLGKCHVCNERPVLQRRLTCVISSVLQTGEPEPLFKLHPATDLGVLQVCVVEVCPR